MTEWLHCERSEEAEMGAIRSGLLLLLLLGLANAIPHQSTRTDTGRQAREDANAYFAQEDTRQDMRQLEDFQREHSDQLARDALPCDNDPQFRLAVSKPPVPVSVPYPAIHPHH